MSVEVREAVEVRTLVGTQAIEFTGTGEYHELMLAIADWLEDHPDDTPLTITFTNEGDPLGDDFERVAILCVGLIPPDYQSRLGYADPTAGL